jgi:hypothetical protein
MWRNGRPYDVTVPEGYVTAGSPVDGRFISALPQRAAKIGVSWPGNFAAHWGFCLPTDTLRSVRGYDERFVKYGPEDSDLIRRLKRLGNQFKYDESVFASIFTPAEIGGSGDEELGRKIAVNRRRETIPTREVKVDITDPRTFATRPVWLETMPPEHRRHDHGQFSRPGG